jgi:hypothetical protein
MRTIVLAASVLSCLLSGAAAHAQSSKLPAVVATDLKAVAAQCVEVGGKALTTEAVKRADLNGDGMEDFVLDVGSINCDGAAGIYGDREKGVTVYVGDGTGGAKSAFSDSVYGATIEGTGPAATLWLTVSGQQCGKKPAADFARENFCDRSIAWNAKTQKFDYAPVSTVRMIQ